MAYWFQYRFAMLMDNLFDMVEKLLIWDENFKAVLYLDHMLSKLASVIS